VADWFILNAREASWEVGQFGAFLSFRESDGTRFEQVGVNIAVLGPGQATGMYHAENNQEGFLVLIGECLLLVEGEQRRLKRWDYFHCPPWTEHVLIGAGEHGCTILGIGARVTREIVYPVSELAQRHQASVARLTHDPREAYASVTPDEEVAYRDEWLG